MAASIWRSKIGLWLNVLRVLSVLCASAGVMWLFMLPMNEYSRGTYISENALLPGQVHTYFGGSEQNIFRAYRIEVERLEGKNSSVISETLVPIFEDTGLKVGTQKYRYTIAGEVHEGENVYAILHAPRGDATEAIVLCAPLLNSNNKWNKGGVALVLSLARYFKRWSIWSKDIIILITSDARAGPQAWVDAYHDTHRSSDIAPLPHTSGAIQGVVVIDFPQDNLRFDAIHIIYDGANGQLSNLDLVNTAVQIATGQMGIRSTFQEMWQHDDSYSHRLKTMLRGMVSQGLGRATGAHSPFIPYHIDAITLQPFGDGWHDEMVFGRTIEGLFRSINNLLEHFHQSFFFYLLMAPKRFVSIGTYLPSAMLIAAGFSLAAMRLWIDSGRSESEQQGLLNEEHDNHDIKVASNTEITGDSGTIRPQDLGLGAPKDAIDATSVFNAVSGLTASPPPLPPSKIERHLFLPVAIVLAAHFFGAIPFAFFNNIDAKSMTSGFYAFLGVSIILPFFLTALAVQLTPMPAHTNLPKLLQLTKCFSLLILGMILASLATLNFSLSFFIGLFAFPLSFTRPFPETPALALLMTVILQLANPFTALLGITLYWNLSLDSVLREAAFAWEVSGSWTSVVVWCVWYPAWLLGCMAVNASWWLIWMGKLKSEEAKGLEKLGDLNVGSDLRTKGEVRNEKD